MRRVVIGGGGGGGRGLAECHVTYVGQCEEAVKLLLLLFGRRQRVRRCDIVARKRLFAFTTQPG